MTQGLNAQYNHKEIEKKIYELWEKSGFFNPDKIPTTYDLRPKPFTIIMPPTNANGALHIGHAVGLTLQDIVVRFERMRGKKTLWLPGADHAGFETQVVYDKKLEKEGRNRHEIPRNKLWQEIWDFTQENKKIMYAQTKKLGASCDWSRETFTLDPKIIKIVYETFKKMHKDGLVYRDLRVINWCPKHRTALSDLEVKYVERVDPLYYIKYGPLTLATVRPETKFGDTALAVNSKDSRYKKYIGKTIEAKGVLGPLKFKVIADDVIDPKFGTGVVKVTPAHDATDFEIWTRHKDEIPGPKIIIDERGRLNELTGEFAGLKVMEAREKITLRMKEIGILEKVDLNYKHQIATCYKCGGTLEPLPKPQWFIKTKPLAEEAIKALKQKKFQIIPKTSEKVYLHWLKNIRDWNISRQIVWGIRIPAWFKNKEIYIGEKSPGKEWIQDPDVFDTWFSSGQWPFAALMKRKGDFEKFYPTDVMETGYDILFFWVARMVMLGLYHTGQVPFKTVFLHGLVRDQDRQKMSKSKGNVIDPLHVAETYGTDAVRMALVAGNTPGQDIVISEDKIRGYRNFATKIWNAARFVLMAYEPELEKIKPAFTKTDQKRLKELKTVQQKITKEIESFKFHKAGYIIYHYFWHTFADKIIEESKERLRSENLEERATAQKLNLEVLKTCLKFLHPFMPFITEEIWGKLPEKNKNLLLVEPWQ